MTRHETREIIERQRDRRLASSSGTRRQSKVHVSQSHHSEFAEDVLVGERAGASSLYLVTSRAQTIRSGCLRLLNSLYLSWNLITGTAQISSGWIHTTFGSQS
jgi:hypothetical protein